MILSNGFLKDQDPMFHAHFRQVHAHPAMQQGPVKRAPLELASVLVLLNQGNENACGVS